MLLGKPPPSTVGKGHEREHHRHLDEHADHCCKCRPAAETKQADCDCDRELKEIGSAYHGAGGGDVVWHFPCISSNVGDGKDTVRLNDDRDGDEGDQQRIREDGLRLKGKEQDDRCE